MSFTGRAVPVTDRRSERARRVATLRVELRKVQREGRALARRAATYRRAAVLDDNFAARAAVARVAWLNNRALAGELRRRIDDLVGALALHPVGWSHPDERALRVAERLKAKAAREAKRRRREPFRLRY